MSCRLQNKKVADLRFELNEKRERKGRRRRETKQGMIHFDIDPTWFSFGLLLVHWTLHWTLDDEGSHAERNRSIHDENGAGILE